MDITRLQYLLDNDNFEEVIHAAVREASRDKISGRTVLGYPLLHPRTP
jgi:hypothetical protein